MNVLVAVKRAIDWNVPIRLKAEGSDVELDGGGGGLNDRDT